MNAIDDTRDSDSLHRMLAAALAHNEQRLARMERNYRGLLLAMLALVALAVAGLYGLLGSNAAVAGNDGLAQRMEQGISADYRKAAQWEQREAQRLRDLEQRNKQEFDKALEAVRSDLAKPGNFDPLHAVAVILRDMQSMLEAVPRMADNMETMTTAMTQMNHKMSAMPNMAVDMHQMNITMGMMAHDVDATMGRMGRMAPW
ncbi:MAG: hypothetical protein P8Z31_04965 [Gammaproteobacteria bacterium]|jgi:hypothetical protein